MASTSAANPTDTARHSAASSGVGPPVQRSLRGVIRDRYEEEGEQIIDALMEDLDSTGRPDEDIADRAGVERAQLARIRQHKMHPPGRLIAWAIDNSRHQPPQVVVAICAAAEGEFKPKPPPSVEDRHAATLDVLHEMGIAEVVRDRVARRLGVTKP